MYSVHLLKLSSTLPVQSLLSAYVCSVALEYPIWNQWAGLIFNKGLEAPGSLNYTHEVHYLAWSGRYTSDNRISILLIALFKGNSFGFCCKFVLNMSVLWIQHFNLVLNRNFAFRPLSDNLTTHNVICFTGKFETQILLCYNIEITALLNPNIILQDFQFTFCIALKNLLFSFSVKRGERCSSFSAFKMYQYQSS